MHPTIQTERLLLRPLDIADLETVHVYASDPENTRYMQHLPNHTKDETAAFLQRVTDEWQKAEPCFYEFAIVLRGEQIGAVSIALDEQRKVGELGWIVNKRYWKTGVATEAALAVKEFALHTLGLHKLIANCDARNTNSYRLMQRLGMALESDSGQRYYEHSGETAQELCFALTV